jgi:hypothetical protein
VEFVAVQLLQIVGIAQRNAHASATRSTRWA